MKAKGHLLEATIKPSKSIRLQSLECMFDIFKKYYSEVDFQTFISDLQKKNHIIMVRDKKTKIIKGFSTIMDMEVYYKGKKINGLFSGDTIIEKDYWGGTALQVAFFRYVFIKLITNPGMELYWFLISKGYKTYLLLANNFPEYYPRFDQPGTEKQKNLVRQFSEYLYADYYDPKKELIIFPGHTCKLKGDIAPISAKHLKNPKIDFFQKRNPTWQKGSELPCVGLIDFNTSYSYVKKLFKKIPQTSGIGKMVNNLGITRPLARVGDLGKYHPLNLMHEIGVSIDRFKELSPYKRIKEIVMDNPLEDTNKKRLEEPFDIYFELEDMNL
ncbi:hypothetical protein MHK_006583 [Candidatus Magnetomorum sp. HK-1]|nr:hypothetical protein MHK_006583 [Candidatus Magnetomorum sp. HK-1]